jgi:uncharacterized protein
VSDRLGVGFCLHPDLEYLSLAREILEDDADFFEVNPETMWRMEEGSLVRNDFHSLYRQIRERSGKPFVAHGLGFSLGTPLAGDERRTEAWLARLRDDQETFGFAWMSEHLGWTTAGGIQGVLPLPLPATAEAVAAVAARMRLLASVVPTVAFENNVGYFALGDPADEPELFNAICRAASCGLLLDLHNVHTQCRNFGLDPLEYIDRIDLERVLEIHLSGGSESDPAWLPSGRVLRLDTHDQPVPEPVWRLMEAVAPRCVNLRGIVLERLNGTFGPADLPALRQELRRARDIARSLKEIRC